MRCHEVTGVDDKMVRKLEQVGGVQGCEVKWLRIQIGRALTSLQD